MVVSVKRSKRHLAVLVHGVTGQPTPEMRVRQNVWLELGCFWGRLGLDRVMILTHGDVAIPCALHGVRAIVTRRIRPRRLARSRRSQRGWSTGARAAPVGKALRELGAGRST